VRYEHFDLNLTTRGCALLAGILGDKLHADIEIANLQNELRARLQRRDADPHSPKNTAPVAEEDWLNA
jgi:hypothetical protein